MIRIVIAEDHIVVAEGFKSLLDKVKGIKIVKIVENGKKLIAFIESNSVELIIMDVMMPVMDGLEATAIIKKKYPKIKILVLSVSHKPLHVQSALDAGADGYLLKETNKNELVSAINLLMEGKTYYAQKVTKSLIGKSLTNKEKIKLTDREVEVLTLLAEGASAKKIAFELNIGENTVKTYRTNLFEKFDVKKTIVLITKALKEGYL